MLILCIYVDWLIINTVFNNFMEHTQTRKRSSETCSTQDFQLIKPFFLFFFFNCLRFILFFLLDIYYSNLIITYVCYSFLKLKLKHF